MTILLLAALALGAPTVEEADAALASGDHATALKGFKAATRRHPDDGRLWYQLASAHYGLEQWAKAAEAFERAADEGFRPVPAKYNAACAAARAGQIDTAFGWLEEVVEAGFNAVAKLEEDPDLEGLRHDRRFAAILEGADRNARPCMHDERYAAFDFWVGSWDVMDPQGNRVGVNRITRVHEGCAVEEAWISGYGGTGGSLNWVDPRTGAWNQTWVDSGGRVIVPTGGGLVDGAMVLTGESVMFDGTVELWRGTWTANEDGTVRQVLERKTGDGDWTMGFDGTYVPRRE